MSSFHDIATSQRARTSPLTGGKFGAQLAVFDGGVKAILKVKGNIGKTFRGIPVSTFHRREVAAYRVDRDLLGFGVVPETLLINWRGQEASLQKYVEGVQPKELVPGVFDRKLDDWKHRIAKFAEMVNLEDMVKIIVLDLVIGNADRHARNLIIDTYNHGVVAIDNGTSFGPDFRLFKNIFYKYLFTNRLDIPDPVLSKLSGIGHKAVKDCIGSLLTPKEVEYTYWRIRFVVDHPDRLAFARVSQGNFNNNEFPHYSNWFNKKMHPAEEMMLLTIPVKPGVVEQKLDKGLHQAVISAALALSSVVPGAGMPHKALVPHVLKLSHGQWNPTGLHPDLHHIAALETQQGKYLNHKANKDPFHTAYGSVGLKPETAHERYMKDPALHSEFKGLENPDKFDSVFRSSHALYNKTASSIWTNYLKAFSGDASKAAYAWRFGRTAAGRASPDEIKNHKYVKGFLDLKNAVKSKSVHIDTKSPSAGM